MMTRFAKAAVWILSFGLRALADCGTDPGDYGCACILPTDCISLSCTLGFCDFGLDADVINATADKGNAWPTQIFAPYVDVTQPTANGNDFNFEAYSRIHGLKFFSLNSILSDSSGNPKWGGILNLDYYSGMIDKLRMEGGDIIVSFGGAVGKELALRNSQSSLTSKYLQVITKLKATWIDLDIEGSALSHRDNVDMRNRALADLQKKLPWNVKIMYTLPASPSGLEDSSIYLLQSAIRYGVKVQVVNLMTMDFGSEEASNGQYGMGSYAISAAVGAKKQLDIIRLNAKIGITPMIGINDVSNENFRVQDAAAVAKWAKGAGYIAFLGMWSANRDNGNCDSIDTSSLVHQGDADYSLRFKVINP